MTAIEWLIEQCPRIETIVASSVFEQAKEMEKQQIIDTFEMGRFNIDDMGNGEEYYNETFKK